MKNEVINVDFHCHSHYSDGALSPVELVARAKQSSVTDFSITDHDSIEGLVEGSDSATQLGIRFYSGIEVSSQWQNRSVHIVGLGFDTSHTDMLKLVDSQHQRRLQRMQLIDERLEKKKITGVLEVAQQISGNLVVGRPHMAAAMVKLGFVKDESDAFKKFLGQGKIGDVSTLWPDVEEVVSHIVSSGGVAVLAHPRKYDFTLTRLRTLIEEFRAQGGLGIEVVTSGQKQGDIGLLTDLCRRYDLLASSGSDFHSPKYPWTEVGRLPALPSGLNHVIAHVQPMNTL